MVKRLGWCLGLGLCACEGLGGRDDSGLDSGASLSADGALDGKMDGLTGPGDTGTDSGSDPSGAEGDPSGADGDPGTTTATTATTTATGPDTEESGDTPPLALPPANAGLDYQLGGAYPPPAGVEIVSRDRNASPAPGLYNICYVNGYQTQPDEQDWWLSEHPDLILRDGNGDPVIDPDWNEMLLDISTADKRAALGQIVGGWIVGCGAAGFDAIEIDNLDTYSRSDGLLTQDQAVEFMSLLSQTAHDGGMAIAQKNSAEIVDRRDEMGTDFVVTEECNRWDECQVYTDVYGDAVLVIEYRAVDFEAGCADFPGLSIVLRDLDLVPAGDPSYVFEGC
jgi:Glycoside-hydrolase family GH114